MARTKETARKSTAAKPPRPRLRRTPPPPPRSSQVVENNRTPVSPAAASRGSSPAPSLPETSSEEGNRRLSEIGDRSSKKKNEGVRFDLGYRSILPTTASDKHLENAISKKKSQLQVEGNRNERRVVLSNSERIKMLKRRKVEIDQEIAKLEELEEMKNKILKLEGEIAEMEAKRILEEEQEEKPKD
ncbi:hypothetical protein JCM5350_006406 [Sporobolomyces pararoseus]